MMTFGSRTARTAQRRLRLVLCCASTASFRASSSDNRFLAHSRSRSPRPRSRRRASSITSLSPFAAARGPHFHGTEYVCIERERRSYLGHICVIAYIHISINMQGVLYRTMDGTARLTYS
jgi:hypothetical protein